jgi:hypothetical protein
MKHLWGIAALVLLTGCAATPAPAVDHDAIFLAAWHETFPNGGDDNAKFIAHGVCDAYKAGTTFTEEVAYLMALAPSLTGRQAGQIIGYATASYCPEFNNRH